MDHEVTAPALEIKLFGGLEICSGGTVVPLPQSKKTRALLAYLILKGTPQRRDALCELLWEVPDDPRGALRWSLSKLRPLVNDDIAKRLTADRERAGFERHGAIVDLVRLEEACAAGLERIPSHDLNGILEACNGELLAGLDLPNQPAYEAWRLAQQERARQLQLRVLNELAERDDVLGAARTAVMRRRVELDPSDGTAHADLVAHLAAAGQRADAEAQAEIGRRMLASLEISDDGRIAAALKGGRPGVTLAPSAPLPPATQLRQTVRFCRSFDGAQIAYATAGSGPPLVKTANWLNHLEFDWESPVFRHMFAAFAERNTLIRYDSRGNGLSDWNVDDLTLNALVNDLKSVVDAAGVDRFPLFAMSQGCAVAVEFAVRWPERVSKLVLFGGYARGWRFGNEKFVTETEALIALTRTGWGKGTSAYRQMITSLFVPSATREQADWFNELQRITTSPEIAAKLQLALGDVNVLAQLPHVSQPTLVMHCREDARVPYAGGRELAAGIPGAKFVTLDSANHLLLEHDPAWPRFLAEMRAFLAT